MTVTRPCPHDSSFLTFRLRYPFNQYERENNRQKSLAGIELAKHLGRPAGRDAEKLPKVAKALEKGLSVAEIVTLTGISRAIVKRYRQEFVAG